MQATLPAVSFRTAALLAGAVLTAVISPAQAAEAAQSRQSGSNGPDAAAANRDATGLPTFLLPVPGGRTWVGMAADQLLRVSREAVNPRNPDRADPDKVGRALRQTASELGRVQVDVPSFLLGRWVVKNREYEVFVKQMADRGTPVKPPFHWWRVGRSDDYDTRLEDIHNQFKSFGNMGPVYYWERYGTELPYKVVDQYGNDIGDEPVVYVSYRDAVKFAGWLGMRLPSELEWTRAARGDGEQLWPWGHHDQVEDVYTEAILKQLDLGTSRDLQLKPVGQTKFAFGPFGHQDMTGQVWELTSTFGFRPINGQEPFEDEWKRLLDDKVGQLAANAPLWKDDAIVVKGASYLSSGDPVQFHIDCRVPVATNDVLESLGFRLAKSPKPGYDMLYSLVNSDYNQDLFLADQATSLELQVGVERYVLSEDGFPESYHAISLAPLNFVLSDKRGRLGDIEERSQRVPVALATLALTETAAQPALPPGIYTVCWRHKGMPRELSQAIKKGHKEVKRELARREKGAEATPFAGEWLDEIKRYGLTAEDLAEADSPGKVDFVRVGELKLPTDQHLFVFYNNQGEWVASAPASHLAAGDIVPATATFGSKKFGDAERARIEFQIGMPLLKDQRKGVEYTIELILDQAPPKPQDGWRLPEGM